MIERQPGRKQCEADARAADSQRQQAAAARAKTTKRDAPPQGRTSAPRDKT